MDHPSCKINNASLMPKQFKPISLLKYPYQPSMRWLYKNLPYARHSTFQRAYKKFITIYHSSVINGDKFLIRVPFYTYEVFDTG